MSIVDKGRTMAGMDPLSDDRLPAWQKELIQKKRGLNRPFSSLNPPMESTTTTAINGDYSGAFHPDAAATTNAFHAPVNHAPRNNKLNNESDGNRAWMSKEGNWNGIRQQLHHFQATNNGERAAEKLSKPSATQASQLSWGLSRQQGNTEPFYFTFNHVVKMGEDKGNVVANNNNTANHVFNDFDSNRTVTNGFAVNGGGEDQNYDSEEDGEYEYGPGIVNRLRSKFNNLTMKEKALLSPVRRVASMEHILDTADDNAPHYRGSPTKRSAAALSNRSSADLLTLTRARSMETLTIVDGGQGTNSVFGRKVAFRLFSREDGTSPLSPVNDKVIIIEQAKPPKQNGAMPLQETGNTKHFPSVRVGQDLAWKNCSNATLIDEELPKPDTVRTKKLIFESSKDDHENQGTSPKTIILRTTPPKIPLPPKPPGLKPGPKPGAGAEKPPVPSAQPLPPSKSVFEYLKKRESAEKLEEAPPVPLTPPPRAPSPTTIVAETAPPAAAIVGETMKISAKSEPQPQPINLPRHVNGSEQNGADVPKAAATNHRIELNRPVQPVKPIVQIMVSSVQNNDEEPVGKPLVGKPQSTNEGNSVNYNFVKNKDVKPHIKNNPSSNYSRLPDYGIPNGNRFEEEVIEEEDFAIDDHLSKPAHVDFVGDNVIVGRSALMKTRNKKLKLAFDDQALSTYEYPSESSLLDEAEEAMLHTDDHHTAIKVKASIEMGPSILKSTPAIGSSIGGLASYTPMVVGNTQVFELGVSRAPPPPPSKPAEIVSPEKDDSDDNLFLKPATDDDNVLWSNAKTSDILF